jgi:ribosomal protein S18 acetylase RimI-like enzyme
MTTGEIAGRHTAADGSPADGLVVRAARASDIAAVAGLDRQNTGLPKPAYWKDMFERYGKRPNRYFLVGVDGDDRVLGFIIGEVRAWEFGSPPSGWIFALGVAPEHRLRKIGSRMFEAMCDCLAAAGVDTVRTSVARDDELNLAFFRSQGMMGGPFIQLEMPLARRRGGQTRPKAAD